MKSRRDPANVPQTEGHPEPFPEVSTLPKGWDLSELQPVQPSALEILQSSIPLELDSRVSVEDYLV
jgi:hypothetical protein